MYDWDVCNEHVCSCLKTTMVAGSHMTMGPSARRGNVGRSDWDGKQRRVEHLPVLSPTTRFPIVVKLEEYHQRHSGLKEAGQYQDAFQP
jgi:hypothetical protein